MILVKWLIIFLKHPLDFKTLVQFYLFYHWKRRNSAWKERPGNSGWDRHTRRRCWELFEMTDKATCTIIKWLDGDLARTVSYDVCTLDCLGQNQRRGLRQMRPQILMCYCAISKSLPALPLIFLVSSLYSSLSSTSSYVDLTLSKTI